MPFQTKRDKVLKLHMTLIKDILLMFVNFTSLNCATSKLARACGVPAVIVHAVSFRQSTAGNGHYSHQYYFRFLRFSFSSTITFSHRRRARIKKLIQQKLTGAPKNLLLSRSRRPFWGPLAAILDFAGVAGGQRAPPSPLGWY